MKILITSGGTAEKIDQVREIKNQATGALGKLLAENFLTAGHDVTLVHGKSALLPDEHPNLAIQSVSDVASLLTTLEPLVKTHHVLIHAMAVSDYSPIYMTDFDRIAKSKDLTEFLSLTNQESKISSEADIQVLFLRKTPKIISLVKQWNPDIQLIGFKLLVNTSKQELLEVAKASLIKNQADYILANDLSDITGDQHRAYLVGHDQVETVTTKQAIAQLILQKVRERS